LCSRFFGRVDGCPSDFSRRGAVVASLAKAAISAPIGDRFMKFVSFKSRGGDYLVVAQNVAWLRSHEDGQTKIGIIGSESIQVAGTIEETAAAILAG
jgi:hypothetical protein